MVGDDKAGIMQRYRKEEEWIVPCPCLLLRLVSPRIV